VGPQTLKPLKPIVLKAFLFFRLSVKVHFKAENGPKKVVYRSKTVYIFSLVPYTNKNRASLKLILDQRRKKKIYPLILKN
jgi:hypothetical protein